MDYFPHDTDAASDEKVDAIRSVFGNDGYAVYFIMLERTYKAGEPLDLSNPAIALSIARKCMVDLPRLMEIIDLGCDLGLFIKDDWISNKTVSSAGIERRLDAVMATRVGKRPAAPVEELAKKKQVNERDVELAVHLMNRIQSWNTSFKGRTAAEIEKWADSFRKMIDLDKRTPELIREMIDRVIADDFWCKNILSAETLRTRWNEGKLEKCGSRTGKQTRGNATSDQSQYAGVI